MRSTLRSLYRALATLAVVAASFSTTGRLVAATDDLETRFHQPPPSARPWVYWFWLNGNITREGITADLEAMKQAGIGGVLIMEVDQGIPVGPVGFMSPQWRALFKHVITEAQRLGLEVNMNDDAGWNGSGGPWIKPEQSMQKVVWSETNLVGPQRFEGRLSQPPTVAGFYRDLTVLAFPTPGKFRIENITGKAAYERQGIGPASTTILPPEEVIDPSRLTNLTAQMDATGHLRWDVPAGTWTVMRLGHTSTGVMNAPSPASGRGLECDKLSPAGIEAQFAGMMGPLIADVGPAAGRTLVATHIDSWENGSQNWTARMREEFQRRRGYDLLPFLPVMSGRVIQSLEVSERFLWDLRQTISELVAENYAGRMEQLARQHGLRLSIEAYGGPCDDMTYGGRADEPMCEFWIGGGAFETCKEMASTAHVYGKPILGAESLTADDRERWQQYPGSIKALGDRAFCEGVSRFVFHRYAMQPWLHYAPGMTMGPWGLHYERTETWWAASRPWHEYLTRCQFLLRQGQFVADLCHLQPEEAPQGFVPLERHGYDYDNCTAEVVLTRLSVRDGRLVLPEGMSYRLLVLPSSTTMTPALLRRLKDLVAAGATILGPRPQRSPSLTGYPQCDDEVRRLGGELWGDCDGQQVRAHAYGQGKVFWGLTPEAVLAQQSLPPDFTGPTYVRWIHRTVGETEIYFVANGRSQTVDAECGFRVTGKPPELWQPETGAITPAPAYTQAEGVTRVALHFTPSGSVFVLFRPRPASFDPVVKITRDGQPVLPPTPLSERLTITKARYGVLDDPARTRDVRAKLQALVDAGELSFPVARMAQGDDPAFGIVKTLIVDYTAGEKRLQARGTDPEEMDLSAASGNEPVLELHGRRATGVVAEAWQAGHYTLTTAAGRQVTWALSTLPAPIEVSGPWVAHFPPHWGAPTSVPFPTLASWSQAADPGVKYFSGTATYSKTITVPADRLGRSRRLYLDLGDVQVMARVKLNGHDLGVLWKAPYRVDISRVAKTGANALEVRVVNLWINRMIGDEQLPEDSERNPNGTLKAWPRWVQEGKPSPTGRYTFTTWRLWAKNAPLVPSGLLGPVRLITTQERALR